MVHSLKQTKGRNFFLDYKFIDFVLVLTFISRYYINVMDNIFFYKNSTSLCGLICCETMFCAVNVQSGVIVENV